MDLPTIITQAAAIGGAFKGFDWLGNFVASKRNGNGKTHGLSLADHDTLQDVKRGVDLLHDDLEGLRHDMRDCMGSR